MAPSHRREDSYLNKHIHAVKIVAVLPFSRGVSPSLSARSSRHLSAAGTETAASNVVIISCCCDRSPDCRPSEINR